MVLTTRPNLPVTTTTPIQMDVVHACSHTSGGNIIMKCSDNGKTMSANGASSSRIPTTLQAVFLASNRGNEVHKPPPDSAANKVYFRNWLFQGRNNSLTKSLRNPKKKNKTKKSMLRRISNSLKSSLTRGKTSPRNSDRQISPVRSRSGSDEIGLGTSNNSSSSCGTATSTCTASNFDSLPTRTGSATMAQQLEKEVTLQSSSPVKQMKTKKKVRLNNYANCVCFVGFILVVGFIILSLTPFYFLFNPFNSLLST